MWLVAGSPPTLSYLWPYFQRNWSSGTKGSFNHQRLLYLRGFKTLTNIPLMKGTVPKRLDISWHFGIFHTILNFYFHIVIPSATQHTKFLTSFTFIYLHLRSFIFIYLHIPSFTFIYVHLPSCNLIYIHLLSSTFIYIHVRSFTFIYVHLPSYPFIYPHLTAFTFIYLHLCSSIFIYVHLPSFTFIYLIYFHLP